MQSFFFKSIMKELFRLLVQEIKLLLYLNIFSTIMIYNCKYQVANNNVKFNLKCILFSFLRL